MTVEQLDQAMLPQRAASASPWQPAGSAAVSLRRSPGDAAGSRRRPVHSRSRWSRGGARDDDVVEGAPLPQARLALRVQLEQGEEGDGALERLGGRPHAKREAPVGVEDGAQTPEFARQARRRDRRDGSCRVAAAPRAAAREPPRACPPASTTSAGPIGAAAPAAPARRGTVARHARPSARRGASAALRNCAVSARGARAARAPPPRDRDRRVRPRAPPRATDATSSRAAPRPGRRTATSRRGRTRRCSASAPRTRR